MESKFTGGLLGLIGVSLLAALISVITLGLALPWAVCIKQRWYAKHTIIDGKQLYFDGTGSQLLGSWIKWLFFTIITCGIYGLWVGLKLQDWVVRHTHVVGTDGKI